MIRRSLAGAAILLIAYALYVAWGLPPRAEVRALARKNPTVTGVMRQRAEEAAAAKRKARREQTWVPISRVSRNLIHAVVVAEDGRFFGHEGIDWESVKESLEKNVQKGRFARGGSTISQQLAKNVFFDTRKSPTRKFREFFVTRWLEADLTKKRILELYLNVIEWGDGVYGCEAAARRYYGKSAADLDEEEAAGLAAMIPSPRRINPRISPSRHARAQRRILWLMARAGYVKESVGKLGAEPPLVEPLDESGPEPTEPPLPALEPSVEPSYEPSFGRVEPSVAPSDPPSR
ncbi:MAG: monofunctional biosynthetic peptidoglycan transglycosylase [Acidobacteria bacterium]|nr:monofunctional biosynthetic peptidoglycan transglycosylase [Acidobacteriota bacterium]